MPVNPAAAIELSDGAVAIRDQEASETLSRETGGKPYVKFIMFGTDTDRPGVYFMNTETYIAHHSFRDAIGLGLDVVDLPGVATYDPELDAPDGSKGVYYYWLTRDHLFSLVERVHTVLSASMPLLEDNLVLYMSNAELPYSQPSLPLFRASRINLIRT